MHPSREDGLVPWQWHHYPFGHRDRRNLLVHVLTAPLFMAGTVAVVAWPFTAWWLAPVGFGAMAAAMAAQGRGHRLEVVAPVPFAGPFDFAARIFVEQWFTFPRYVLTGGLIRAWREGAS